MAAPVVFGELYHTGIVVDDVEAAKAEYTDVMGVEWGPEGEYDVPVWLPDGRRNVTFKMAYTAQGPHRLELVRAIPGTLWTVTGPGMAHHLGYWSDDVTGASEELSRRGLALLAKVAVDEDDANPVAVFHQARTGAYIELVSSAGREAMFGPST
jgi:catechol 2,3-dioxygenase-like lactoylglutathione lyase family enzyme